MASDHDNAVAVPLAGAGPEGRTREYRVKTNRPITESGIRDMGLWLANIQWEEELKPYMSPQEQDKILRSILTQKLDDIFPEKSVRVSNQDDPFVTSEIKKLQMYLKREY